MTTSDFNAVIFDWRAGTLPGRKTGFTLIELLAVLVIMALVMAVALPSFIGRQGVELDAAARSLAAGLRWSRNLAQMHNRSTSLTLDVQKRQFTVSGERRVRVLPGDARIALYTARSELQSDERGAIRFFPDGTSTGGRITLSGDRYAVIVDVDWLTGRVRVREGGSQVARDGE